ncbi:hypothetical protein HS5_20120 [Acidianus sp. HS-5]|nr:hypothetical protein HS5_20120 [Acidianus sp. HS-5]
MFKKLTFLSYLNISSKRKSDPINYSEGENERFKLTCLRSNMFNVDKMAKFVTLLA